MPRERRLLKIGRYELLHVREGDEPFMDTALTLRVHPPREKPEWPDNADSII